MSDVGRPLRRKRRRDAELLRALEHRLAIFDTTEQADHGVLTADPDRRHRPQTDLVFRKIPGADPMLAQTMAKIMHAGIAGSTLTVLGAAS